MRWPGIGLIAIAALGACSDGTQGYGIEFGSEQRVSIDSSRVLAPVDSTRVLSEHGVGRLRIGMTVDEARAALGGSLALGEPLNGPEPEGCRTATSDGLPDGWIMFEGLRVVRIDVDSSFATAAGARVGQTLAQVRAIYPDARVMPHHYVDGHYLVVIPGAPTDTMHRIVLETDTARVTGLRGGGIPAGRVRGGVRLNHEIIRLLAQARSAEKAQALFYRSLASQSEEFGDPVLSERLNDLHADEQHHLSRLTARLIELGEPLEDIDEARVERPSLKGWEAVARPLELAEIARYESLLSHPLDPATIALLEEILGTERHHAEVLGGKWMPA